MAEDLPAAQVDELEAQRAAAAVEVLIEPRRPAWGRRRAVRAAAATVTGPTARGRASRWRRRAGAVALAEAWWRRRCRRGPSASPPERTPRARRGRPRRRRRRAGGGGSRAAGVTGTGYGANLRARGRSWAAHGRQQQRTGGPWWSQRASDLAVDLEQRQSRALGPRRRAPTRAPSRRARPGCGPRASLTAAVTAAVSSAGQYRRVTECQTTVSTSSSTGVGEPFAPPRSTADARSTTTGCSRATSQRGGQPRVAVELPRPDERGEVGARPRRLAASTGATSQPRRSTTSTASGTNPAAPHPSTTSGESSGPVAQSSPTKR